MSVEIVKSSRTKLCSKLVNLPGAWLLTLFQITFRVRESMKDFEGLVDKVLSKSSQVYHSIFWVRKSAFLGFDLRPLYYLEDCLNEIPECDF